jgi:hypothetical protein
MGRRWTAVLALTVLSGFVWALDEAGAQDAPSDGQAKERPAEPAPAAATDAKERPEGEPAAAPAPEAAPAVVERPAAERVDLKALRRYSDSIGEVGLREEEPALLADGTTFERGAFKVTFDNGYFFPVFSGMTAEEWAEDQAEAKDAKKEDEEDADAAKPEERGERRVVGYAFVGSGTIEMKWGEKRFAYDLANHLVRDLDRDPEQYRKWINGEPIRANVTQGLVMGADPAFESFLAALPQVAPEGTKESSLGKRDPVVVPDAKAFSKARDTAEKMYEDRLELFGNGMPVTSWIRSDRMAVDKLGLDPADVRVVADFLTDMRFGLASDKKGGNPAGDRWLSQVHDPTGTYEGKLVDDIFSVGSIGGNFSGATLNTINQPPSDPNDPLSPPLPANHWDAVKVDQTLKAKHTKDGFYIEGEVTQLVTVRAAGPKPPRVVRLDLAPFEAVKDTWEMLGLTLEDGTPCTWFEPDEKPFKDMNRTATCILPVPPVTGDEVTIRINAKGTMPYANLLTGESAGMQGSLGQSTGLQMIMPSVSPGLGGGAFVVKQRLGVPTDSKLTVALSGRTLAEWEEDGYSWQEAETDDGALYPGLAIGNWRSVQVPGIAGEPGQQLPAIRAHLFDKDINVVKAFPPEMRKIIALYQQFLPPFPWTEMELFQAPDMFYGYVWIAPHGMVNLQQTRVFNEGSAESAFRDGTPNMEAGVLAHEIAHQYWGHTVHASHISEGWVNETMSESFSMLFVGNAYGPDSFGQRLEKYREVWQDEIPDGTTASMVRAYESGYQPLIVYNYGPYVMHGMLRRRIGDEAFFRAIDQFVRDHYKEPISSEQFIESFVKQAGEQYTADQVRAFFDFWVYGGYIPDEVLVTYRVSGSKIVGEVTSDVPFGTFDVPVRIIESADAVRDIMVNVVDGKGTFETPDLPSAATAEVVLDPNSLILTRSRKVKQGS